MTVNSLSIISSTPFTGLATQTYNVPTTGLYSVGVSATIPWRTSDQPIAVANPEAAEIQTVTTVADVSGSLNNTYFEFYIAGNNQFAVSGTYYSFYYVWFNINSAGTDPAPAGGYGIQVAGATNASANTLAAAIKTAINAVTGIPVLATSATNVVTLTNTQYGACTAAVDTGTTGFTFAVTTAGTYGRASGLTVTVKHGSTILFILSQPTPTQATMSGQYHGVQCTAGDTITVITSSLAAADALPNAVQGVINVYAGV